MLPEIWAALQPDEMVIITADHGCDPTWQGMDHTREHVLVIAFGAKITPCSIGKRDIFARIERALRYIWVYPPWLRASHLCKVKEKTLFRHMGDK
ncbi:MAG: hypothetical protein K9G26_10435 [Emcibacter sp.]|nr:hypothetical protein [Emcibacter sp.]